MKAHLERALTALERLVELGELALKPTVVLGNVSPAPAPQRARRDEPAPLFEAFEALVATTRLERDEARAECETYRIQCANERQARELIEQYLGTLLAEEPESLPGVDVEVRIGRMVARLKAEARAKAAGATAAAEREAVHG